MMGWTAYRLVYQAKSPIHIGWHTLGYIKLTRYYIPGKNIWASFTDNLTRTDKKKDTTVYKKYGEELLNKEIFISYFYPAIYQNMDIRVLLPEYTPDGLKYGSFSASEFEKLFIKSYGQTAILPESNTAEDESLHESEFIAPVVEYETDILHSGSKDGESNPLSPPLAKGGKGGFSGEITKEQLPVYFVGYVFIKNSAKTIDKEAVGWDDKNIKLNEIVSEIFVGGDRKYGWGRLVLKEHLKIEESDKFFGHEFKLTAGNPEVAIQLNKPIPAHIPANYNLKLKGDIEPLVGREWGEIKDSKGKQKFGAGQNISKANICWVPGSIFLDNKDLKINEYGILKT